MALENNTIPAFSFSEGMDNINGRYLRATQVREAGIGIIVAGILLFVATWAFFIGVLVNWE